MYEPDMRRGGVFLPTLAKFDKISILWVFLELLG